MTNVDLIKNTLLKVPLDGWICLYVRAFLNIGFLFFYLDLDFLNKDQNPTALQAQMYLITNSHGGRQA